MVKHVLAYISNVFKLSIIKIGVSVQMIFVIESFHFDACQDPLIPSASESKVLIVYEPTLT